MLNIDVVDFYDRVNEGTKVVVIGTPRRIAKAPPLKRKLRKIVREEQVVSTGLFPRWHLAGDRPGKKVALKSNLVRKTNFNLNRPKLALE
jgi:hypothetical protein